MTSITPYPWKVTAEDIEAILNEPPIITPAFLDQTISAEAKYLDEGIRRALGLWASELEPELMYLHGQTRPFGITAKGHRTPYIEIKWDDNFYLTGEPQRYSIRRTP